MARPKSQDRGAAAVEMAFIMVFLLILTTGIIDVGRAIFTNIAIQEAAQEGAHLAAFEGPVTKQQIRDRVIESTSSPALRDENVDVDDCVEFGRSLRAASRVTVRVSYELEPITPFVGQWIGNLQLEKSAQAERFYPDCPS